MAASTPTTSSPASVTAYFPDEEQRGRIVTIEKIGTRTQEEIAEYMAAEHIPGIPVHGVTLYRLTYRTLDFRGDATVASGAVAVPDDLQEPAPLLSFHHGTVVARDRVPSVEGFDLISMGLGSSGYVTVLPDYLGLGVSEGLHPYMHAESSSNAVVDMLRAAREMCLQHNIELSDQLFLMGYSEGGYVTMAVHQALEEHHTGEFTVTASAPMAGPYNLSVVMVDQILEEVTYPSPGYLPYTLLSYDMVYDVYDELGEVFNPKYIEVVESLFDGTHSLREINRRLPAVPRELLTPSFTEALQSNEQHPLRLALKENDVHNWKPVAPMRLFHCVDDDQVSFRNAEKALEAFREQGADHVELAQLTFGGHDKCAPPSLFLGKLWFDGFVHNDPNPIFQANIQIIRAGAH